MEIRRALNLKPGDKVLFMQNENGQITIGNASTQAIYKAQAVFEGVAEKMGVTNEDDVQTLVNEVRYKNENTR
jgi:bifunctional DNA-binding transcriptional regulator/antitoxin component of YhaV-PrlF toxin-antitoxin module